MSKSAVYPGSFDPLTNGHIDIIERALNIFGHLIIGVLNNPMKQTLFSVEERVAMLCEATKPMANVEICAFDGLLVDFLRQRKATVIIRGLRAVSDFEYEMQMALMNRKLSPTIDTVFLMPAEQYTYLSSSIIKEIIAKGGKTQELVPPFVERKVQEKFSLTNK